MSVQVKATTELRRRAAAVRVTATVTVTADPAPLAVTLRQPEETTVEAAVVEVREGRPADIPHPAVIAEIGTVIAVTMADRGVMVAVREEITEEIDAEEEVVTADPVPPAVTMLRLAVPLIHNPQIPVTELHLSRPITVTELRLNPQIPVMELPPNPQTTVMELLLNPQIPVTAHHLSPQITVTEHHLQTTILMITTIYQHMARSRA